MNISPPSPVRVPYTDVDLRGKHCEAQIVILRFGPSEPSIDLPVEYLDDISGKG
jgi:hypothetical protein